MSERSERSERAERSHDEYSRYTEWFTEYVKLDADDPRRPGLRDRLVTAHMPLAEHIALRFRDRGIPGEDLRQVAMVGLVGAVDRFDPERGDFLSFAVPTVMGEVRRHFRDTGWTMRVPRRLKDLHLRISQAVSELSQRTGRAPKPSAIAEYLGIDVQEVYEGLEAGQAYHPDSIDEPLQPDDSGDVATLGDTLGGRDPEFGDVDNRELVEPLLSQLPRRERTILVLRFYGNNTQSEIAERLGISQMHVSRLLSQTLRQLRDQLAEPAPPAD